jgi:aminoglycoside phosphotransferase (APT) family kinase protein
MGGRETQDIGPGDWQALLPAMLRDAGLDATGPLEVVPLTGGVSSDIVRVRLADGRQVAAKRALAQLKTASEWRASTERNHNEAEWLRAAGAIVPGATPRVLAEDQRTGTVLLEYLPPDAFTGWKADLLAGNISVDVARAVADTIGRIHAATFNNTAVAATFATDALFDELRLDPYLRTTAARHPDVSAGILSVLEETAASRQALVHGDLSPKNILVGKHGARPVILDAECAWYGDPAFDAAFCLNHLVLKAVHMPAHADALRASADAYLQAWLSHFDGAVAGELERRTAALLPCLMLARVDGKSPVEYLSPEGQAAIRRAALSLIAEPPTGLGAILDSISS